MPHVLRGIDLQVEFPTTATTLCVVSSERVCVSNFQFYDHLAKYSLLRILDSHLFFFVWIQDSYSFINR